MVLPSLENGKSKNVPGLDIWVRSVTSPRTRILRLFVRLISLFGHHASLSAMGGHALEVAVPSLSRSRCRLIGGQPP